MKEKWTGRGLSRLKPVKTITTWRPVLLLIPFIFVTKRVCDAQISQNQIKKEQDPGSFFLNPVDNSYRFLQPRAALLHSLIQALKFVGVQSFWIIKETFHYQNFSARMNLIKSARIRSMTQKDFISLWRISCMPNADCSGLVYLNMLKEKKLFAEITQRQQSPCLSQMNVSNVLFSSLLCIFNPTWQVKFCFWQISDWGGVFS